MPLLADIESLRRPVAVRLVVLLAVVAVGIAGSGRLAAQSDAGNNGDATSQPVATANPAPAPSPVLAIGITLGGLEHAHRHTPRTQTQLRRIVDRGNVVTIREELIIAADGSAQPPYSLRFLGVEGEPSGSPLWQRWSQQHSRHANFLQQHGGFAIRDVAKAQANYTLHNFGPIVRAGRTAERIVVFPNRLDKAVWLVDVDAASNLPLYTAEYDSQYRLLSEVEVVSFAMGAQLLTSNAPSMTVTVLSDFDAAKVAMNSNSIVRPQLQPVQEYGLTRVQVIDNPLNARKSLVLIYSDGVDEFFVTQSPGTTDVFATLPSQAKTGGRDPNTVARYRDTSMSVLTFWHDGVTFQVSGRGSLRRLDEFARRTYTQVITGRG